jgi:hypothetical protein
MPRLKNIHRGVKCNNVDEARWTYGALFKKLGDLEMHFQSL